MNEDQSRARTGYAAENLATLRRLALNLLKREATKKTRHQRQTAQRQLESRLPPPLTRHPNLDALALGSYLCGDGRSWNYLVGVEPAFPVEHGPGTSRMGPELSFQIESYPRYTEREYRPSHS